MSNQAGLLKIHTQEMTSLSKKLSAWQQAQIITEQQSQAIKKFEDDNESTYSWAAAAVAGIGIVVILTGVISIIASNWESIPGNIKILTYFIIQASLGVLVLAKEKQPSLIREVAITSFAGFLLAGIALIGQVYNLRGDSYQALGFWLLLSFPIVLHARSRLSPHLWLFGLMGAVALWVSDANGETISARLLSTISIAFLVASVGLLRRSFSPQFLCSAARFWSFIFLAGVVTVVGNILWLQGYDSEWLNDNEYRKQAYLILLSSLIACLAVLFSKGFYSKPLSITLYLMLISIAAYCTLPFFNLISQNQFTAFIGFQIVWCSAAVAAGFAKKKRLFDLITIIITLRFVIVYFEIFGTMLSTGSGLVISGLVILSFALLWNKYRRELAAYLGSKV